MSPERRSHFNPEAKISTFNGEPILPPSSRNKKLSVEDLRTTYPLRYKAYVRAQGLETNGNEKDTPSDVLTRRLRMVNNLDRYITAHETSEQKRVLREKQMLVFKDIRDSLEKVITEGFVEAPTGFGKTVLFSQIIKATDQKTVVAVPTRILVEQTYERFKQFNLDLDVGRFYSDKKERGKKVTITTYKSFSSLNSGINPKDVDLLILDEVHQSLTGPRIDAVGMYENAVKFGFTATPEYTKDKRVEKLLNNEIHNITLKEAVETGLLSSFSVYLAETEVDLSKVSIARNGDYEPKELEAAINIQSRNKSAVELYQKLVENNPDLSKSIVNCISINHAKEVARLFKEAGIAGEAVYGTQDPKERDDIIKRYKEGQLKALTNVNVLTEGFDVPEASLAINLRPTLSVVVAKQRGGRILRLDPENPAKHAVIVDYLDKNEKKRNLQITFAQVAHGVRIINPAESDIRQQNERNRQEKEPKETEEQLPPEIKGLRVITNTKEVLKIVKELEIQMREPSPIDEKDLIISRSSIESIFIGGFQNLKPVISEVLEELKKEYPDILKKKIDKKTYTTHVTIVTNKDLFIQNMLNKGVKLRQPLDNIQAEDFPTTYNNIVNMFEGQPKEIVPIAREILKELKASNPDPFALRKNKAVFVPVLTDTKPFIEAMLAKGIKLKISKSQTIGENEIANTKAQLSGAIIVKNYREVRTVANQVFKEIKNENPQLVTQRKSGFKTVTVVTDKDIFLEKMQKRGFKLRDKSIQSIKPTDFSTSSTYLTTFFIGTQKKLLRAANEIISSLSEQMPEFIARREIKKGTIVNVVTDRELFIRLMQEKGIKIRQNTPVDIFP